MSKRKAKRKRKIKKLTVKKDGFEKGYVHLYYGKGKGTTSAAYGHVLRVLSHGFSVTAYHFLKELGMCGEALFLVNQKNNGATANSNQVKEKEGEPDIPDISLDYQVEFIGKKCPYRKEVVTGNINCKDCMKCVINKKSDLTKRQRERVEESLKDIKKSIKTGTSDLFILDGILNLITLDIIPARKIVDLIDSKHSKSELILTGEKAPYNLIQLAHIVTQMKGLKYYSDPDIYPRFGIEF